MENMTLREVCEALNISRRTIQGYENAGLVKASGKNERGHLLYDEKAQERIRKIKLYQRLGFKLKEISQWIDAPKEVQLPALKKKLRELEEQRAEHEETMKEANRLISEIIAEMM